MSSSRSKRATGGVNHSEPINHYLSKETPRVRKTVDLGFTRFTGDERTPDLSFTSSPKEPPRLTEEQAQEVQKLIDTGTSAKDARAAVLGEGA
jgi:hypothetical protein